jgi:hypothetical protein
MAFATIQLITHPKFRPTLKVLNGAHEAGNIQLVDEDGKPIDLTTYAPQDLTPVTLPRPLPMTQGILVTFAGTFGQVLPEYTKPGTIVGDPTNGEFQIEILPADLEYPGLYLGEVNLITGGEIRQGFSMYLESAPSLRWQWNGNPLSIAEIRLWTRDHTPEVNDLLDEVEYKDSEVVAAIRRGVDLWNSTPPMMTRYTFSPLSFPDKFRSPWIDVTIGFLKEIAAEWYERNHLQYQAGGVTIDDRNKWQSYRQDALRRLQQYQQWMAQVKVQINAQQAFSRIGYFRLP